MWRDVKGCEGMWRDASHDFAVFCHFVTTTSSRISSIYTMKSVTVSLHIHGTRSLARKFRWGKFQSQTKRQSLFGDLPYKLPLNTSYSLIHMPLIIISYHHFRWGPCEVGTVTAQMAAHRLPMSTLRLLAGKNSVRLRGCAGRPAELAMLTKRCHCHPIRIHQDIGSQRWQIKMSHLQMICPFDIPSGYLT